MDGDGRRPGAAVPTREEHKAPWGSDGSLRELFDGIPVGVYRTTPTGQILDANLAFAQMLGYPHPDALLKVNAGDVYAYSEDRAQWKALIDQAGVVHDFELRLRHTDGKVIWVRDSARAIRDPKGSIQFYQGTLEDITERKAAEDARRKSEALFHLLFEDAPIGMLLVGLDHTLIKTNRALCELLGYTAEELNGKKFTDITHPDDVEQDIRSMKARISGGPQEYKTKKRYLKKNGETVWVHLTAKMIRDENGNALYGLGMVEDITERQRAEAALEQANEHLTRSIGELEQRSREMTLLSEMGDLLQSCADTEEACAVIAQRLPQVFPADPGTVCVISASRKLVETVAAWGESQFTEAVFAPSECWALRRGRPHVVVRGHQSLPACRHFRSGESAGYICVPMMAQGESIGLVTLRADGLTSTQAAGERVRLIESKQRLAAAVAEQIALALANLNLRETLRLQSIRDSLTGLFNRRYMEEPEDIVCRHGGEEFAVILPDACLETTRQRAEHLRDGAKTLQVQHRGQSLGSITLSAGVAAFPDHGSAVEVLLREADAALYRAKAEGRDRVVVAQASDDKA